jgi:hypothetical protein
MPDRGTTKGRMVWLALFVLLGAGCAREESAYEEIPLDAEPLLPATLVGHEPLTRIGWTSGDPEFGSVVDGVVLDDSTAVVLDAQRGVVTFLFTDGHWLEMGGLGGGPGEFERLHAIVRLPGGELAIQDVGQGRLTIIDSGVIVETLSSSVLTRATVIAGTGDDGWITGPPMPVVPIPAEPGWVSMPVLRWDRAFLTADTLLVIDHADMSVPTPFPFGGYVAASHERLAVAISNIPRLDWHDQEGERMGSTELDLEPRPLDDSAWARYVWGIEVRLGEEMGDDELARMLAPQRAEASEHLPYLGSFWFDQDGRLWVGRYAPDFWHPEEYQVIAPDGGLPQRVRTPESVQVLDAGEGLFLAVERDDLGVEAVSLYASPR